MPGKDLKEKALTVPEVRELLEKIGEENLDQFQRRAYDYAMKFAKVESKAARALFKRLLKEYELEEEEAAQLVNCMPETIGEVRVFLAGGRRIVETKKLTNILELLNEYRKKV